MRRWRELPFSAKIKTVGYVISVASVVMLAIVSWTNAATNPLLAVCLAQLTPFIVERRDLTEASIELPAFAHFGFGFDALNAVGEADDAADGADGSALFCDGFALIDARHVHGFVPYRSWDAYQGWIG